MPAMPLTASPENREEHFPETKTQRRGGRREQLPKKYA
jgi:hypothetical protein